MKRLVLWLMGSFMVVTALFAVLVTHQWFTDKPFTLRLFLDREVIKLILASPQMKSSMGLHKLGFDSHNAHLDDVGDGSVWSRLPDIQTAREIVASYNESDHSSSIQQQAVLFLLDRLLALEPFRNHDYPLTTFGGVQSTFPEFMAKVHPIATATDVEHYLSRLAESERYFKQIVAAINLRYDKGIIPPLSMIDNVIEQMLTFVNMPLDENLLLTSLQERMSNATSIPHAEQQKLYTKAKSLVAEVVYPAYYNMIDTYQKLRKHAGTGDGMWRLPDGDKAYKALLHFFTTTELTPNEIFNTGEEEVARIQQQIMNLLAQEGYDTSQGFGTAFANFRSDDKLYYPDSAEGRRRVISDMQQAIDKIRQRLPEFTSFTELPALTIERSPVLSEQNDSLARYENNTILVNLADMRALPKHELSTLAYHEGIPGHHLQYAIVEKIPGLSLLMQAPLFGAYIEGWGMYAEQLPYELAPDKSSLELLSILTYDLHRSARMVIDTGIHSKRWSRKQAIAYLVEQAGQTEKQATIEVDRAIAMPGSGPMYKIGFLKLKALRQQMKVKLGENFSLKGFHDAILEHGQLPLPLLEQVMTERLDNAPD